MPPLRGALFVEGKGERDAAPRLMKGLWQHLGLQPFVEWEVALQSTNLKDDDFLARQLEATFALRNGRYNLLVVLFDSDEKTGGQLMCPRDKGPATANVLAAANLPIPSAVVLPYKEYEHWFVACLPQWAGRPVIDQASQQELARVVGDPTPGFKRIGQRDGKGIIRDSLTPSEYNPTIHQSALTDMLDFDYLQKPEIDEVVPAFGTLCRALRFLAQNFGQRAAVYPPAA